jgi:hypothetical protein
VGAAELPRGAPVEIEVILSVEVVSRLKTEG